VRTPLNKEISAVAVMDDDKEQENTKEDLHTFFKSRKSMSVSDPYFKRKVADTFMGGVENPDEPKKKGIPGSLYLKGGYSCNYKTRHRTGKQYRTKHQTRN